MPCPLPSPFSDPSQTHLSALFCSVLLQPDQDLPLQRNTKALYSGVKAIQAYSNLPQMSTIFTELSRDKLGLGPAPCHARVPPFARTRRSLCQPALGGEHWDSPWPISSYPTLFSYSLWSREEGEKLFTLFLSSLLSCLTVVSVSSRVVPWSTGFWGVDVAAGQQSVKDSCREETSSVSLLSSVPTKAGDGAVYLFPSQKLCAGGRNGGGREGEMERGEKKDKRQESKHGKKRKALHNLWTCCSQVTFFTVASFHVLLGRSENAPTRKGF